MNWLASSLRCSDFFSSRSFFCFWFQYPVFVLDLTVNCVIFGAGVGWILAVLVQQYRKTENIYVHWYSPNAQAKKAARERRQTTIHWNFFLVLKKSTRRGEFFSLLSFWLLRFSEKLFGWIEIYWKININRFNGISLFSVHRVFFWLLMVVPSMLSFHGKRILFT